MTMARLPHSDLDLERGVFLLPNGQANQSHSPDRSPGSTRTDENGEETLSTSRDTESSTATPTRPLLVTRTESLNLNNGHGPNGYTNTKQHLKTKQDVNRKKKHKLKFWKGKEHLCCLFGTVTFLLGAIFVCIGLILFINSRAVLTAPCSSALTNPDSTVSSPVENSPSHRQHTMLTSTTIEPTTTFNYDELVNLASGLERFAYQSSTYNDEQQPRSASYALDGSANYTMSSGSCALTETQLKPFWWIDMQTYKLVKRIRIFKPTDCCDDGLTDFEIRIGQQEELNTNALCKHFPGTNLDPVVEVVCNRQIYGRYLSIQLLGEDGVQRQLALCEVEIYEH